VLPQSTAMQPGTAPSGAGSEVWASREWTASYGAP